MDFSPLALLAPTLFWLLPLAFAIGLLKSPWVKGYLGLLSNFNTTLNLVESVFRAGDGREKAFYRRADSRLP